MYAWFPHIGSQIVRDESWCSTDQLKWGEVTKKILNEASMEAHHNSRLRGVLDKTGKDGKNVWSCL